MVQGAAQDTAGPPDWEDRFARPEYLFGTAPADYLMAHTARFQPGQTALCVADGEGRNGVWLAERGLSVTTLEYAPSAVAKAKALATERSVTLDARLADVLADDWGPGGYDHVIGIFIQFADPAQRGTLFGRMAAATAPGGLTHLHGYTPEQIALGTGGPGKVENLYTPDMLAGAFPDWEVLENRPHRATIHEGTAHNGPSALIDFIARKPA